MSAHYETPSKADLDAMCRRLANIHRVCELNADIADTIWWLAQPFWSVDGNERRAEHYARHVMSRLERDSRSPYQMRWGTDTHEFVPAG